MKSGITVKSIGAADEEFLFEVFCKVHEGQFASLQVPAGQKAQLLKLQFAAREQQYRHQFPDADFDLVLREGIPIGNFYAQRGPNHYVLIDVSLLPEQRSAGIGAALVRELIAQAHTAGKPLRAHVLRQNPAWRLWQRLGFRMIGDDGVYLEIEVPADE